ncbi:uncharacterized protein LOC143422643 [Xylocopa sonorina]|uniref:uncharacterized protein LOC143422643 n=1 Tax=Xylocopa sonorina TaxID=1818115 RepID=UPI00403A96EE
MLCNILFTVISFPSEWLRFVKAFHVKEITGISKNALAEMQTDFLRRYLCTGSYSWTIRIDKENLCTTTLYSQTPIKKRIIPSAFYLVEYRCIRSSCKNASLRKESNKCRRYGEFNLLRTSSPSSDLKKTIDKIHRSSSNSFLEISEAKRW